MMTSQTALDSLKRQRPEWLPWLTVVGEVLRDVESPHWDRAVPSFESHDATIPLLAGASLAVDPVVMRGLLDRVLRRAAASETRSMATLHAAIRPEVDPARLFAASLEQETEHVSQVAVALSVDVEAMQAVIALLPVPFLHACNRHGAHLVPEGWSEGYCPVCGSWPVFVEVRGIERSRYFRCGRCGGEWYARALVCAFCGLSDHEQLTTLVPARSGVNAVIEACNGCHGYVKAFTRLQACPPGTVMIEDLASADLDMAALEHGYARPPGPGCRLGVTVAATPARRHFFGWNT